MIRLTYLDDPGALGLLQGVAPTATTVIRRTQQLALRLAFTSIMAS